MPVGGIIVRVDMKPLRLATTRKRLGRVWAPRTSDTHWALTQAHSTICCGPQLQAAASYIVADQNFSGVLNLIWSLMFCFLWQRSPATTWSVRAWMRNHSSVTDMCGRYYENKNTRTIFTKDSCYVPYHLHIQKYHINSFIYITKDSHNSFRSLVKFNKNVTLPSSLLDLPTSSSKRSSSARNFWNYFDIWDFFPIKH